MTVAIANEECSTGGLEPMTAGRTLELNTPTGLTEELKVDTLAGLELFAHGERHLIDLVGDRRHAKGVVGVRPPALGVGKGWFAEDGITDNPNSPRPVSIQFGRILSVAGKDAEAVFGKHGLDGVSSGQGFKCECAVGIAGEEVGIVIPALPCTASSPMNL